MKTKEISQSVTTLKVTLVKQITSSINFRISIDYKKYQINCFLMTIKSIKSTVFFVYILMYLYCTPKAFEGRGSTTSSYLHVPQRSQNCETQAN